MLQSAQASATDKPGGGLGRLTALGPREPWQVALLLPRTWDDLSNVVTAFEAVALRPRLGETVVLRGRLADLPQTHFRPVPRVNARIIDAQGRSVSFAIFGNTADTAKALTDAGGDLCLWGRIDEFKGEIQLANSEVVHPAWAGRLRPRYPGKSSVIGAALVRERVVEGLRAALDEAEQYLCEQAAGGDRARLLDLIETIAGEPMGPRQVLVEAHVPRTVERGQRAQSVLERLSALVLVRSTLAERDRRGEARWHAPRDAGKRAAGLPFTLNTDQDRAIQETLEDMAEGAPMHRLLAGDVGTGKTAVYGVVAATAMDAGARVAVLAPNTGLVAQIAENLSAWWPDLDVLAVTGATRKREKLVDRQCLVGTTALLHRDIGERDLVIVDEQHKFSRGQREELLAAGCHLLEVTATCTPRSQALVELGVRETSRLTMRSVKRRVETRLWDKDSRPELMEAIEQSLGRGEQVLVICPERGEQGGKANGAEARKRASDAFVLWEKRFPGRVRLSHGGLKAAEKTEALQAMRDGEADILVSTTVVEVGIDLPRLNRVVVLHANRLGLVTLHQIRGRVARAGGTGYCDLYVPDDGAEVERLNVLCQTDDGFEIAEKDLRLRGFGDLSSGSDAEKGFLDGLLFQRGIEVAHVEEAARLLENTPFPPT
ncbi:DEAD/DEAH box helicase [Modicisalibacter sp. MOD 31.J]|uniref:DEAD/DEAH box helicase n=1 Tax=Modicisalibacter sp. MOD 31.J TaxID=2831897 RepID=UPI001CCB31D2|nr:DEAD/DEAH box helicase [Modicisalibacter sp. MOD 31.J]MBZ9574483.1 DEAD/DEAH box helicase family protein [Modicisalibacter sp. MOD 31.J]